MRRIVYVYRLAVSLPAECIDPDWRPPTGTWEHLRGIRVGESDRHGGPWRWPRRRLFTNAETANRAASKMISWGAAVDVQRSEPVVWAEQLTLDD